MAQSIEEKLVFALSPEGQGDGVPILLVGLPTGAWEYMKDGKTQHFDLTSLGMPVKMVLFGAKDHASAMVVLEDAMKASKRPYLDERRTDFSIKQKAQP